jgi:hypothetical protein
VMQVGQSVLTRVLAATAHRGRLTPER